MVNMHLPIRYGIAISFDVLYWYWSPYQIYKGWLLHLRIFFLHFDSIVNTMRPWVNTQTISHNIQFISLHFLYVPILLQSNINIYMLSFVPMHSFQQIIKKKPNRLGTNKAHQKIDETGIRDQQGKKGK